MIARQRPACWDQWGTKNLTEKIGQMIRLGLFCNLRSIWRSGWIDLQLAGSDSVRKKSLRWMKSMKMKRLSLRVLRVLRAPKRRRCWRSRSIWKEWRCRVWLYPGCNQRVWKKYSCWNRPDKWSGSRAARPSYRRRAAGCPASGRTWKGWTSWLWRSSCRLGWPSGWAWPVKELRSANS